MKQIGAPLVLDLFRPYFKKFLEKYGTRAVTFLKGPKYKLPKHVEAAGITLSQTNFSIVLHTQELFHNTSTFDFQTGLRSLQNLTITNEILMKFLETDVYQMVTEIAHENITQTIDHQFPVIVNLEKGHSFLLFKIFYTTIANTPTSIQFTIFNLPIAHRAGLYSATSLPTKFSSNGASYTFDQGYSNRGIETCIDSILAGSYVKECTQENINPKHIVKGFKIGYYQTLYILIDTESHFKIMCPGKVQVNNRLSKKVSIFAISPSCSLALTMITGTITVKPEAAFNGPILEPIFIGEYDTASQDTFDYQLIVIITIGITTILVV